MAQKATIIVSIEPEIKKQAEIILNQLGISMSTAIEMFLQQIVLQQKIPFEANTASKQSIIYNNLQDKNLILKDETYPVPNAETLAALREVELMKQNPTSGTRHTDIDELFGDFL